MSNIRCTGTKTCSKCNVTKPVLAFAAQAGKEDGLRSTCRDCDREYDATRRKRKRKPHKNYRELELET